MGLTDDAGTELGTYAREHPNAAEAQNAGNFAEAAYYTRLMNQDNNTQ